MLEIKNLRKHFAVEIYFSVNKYENELEEISNQLELYKKTFFIDFAIQDALVDRRKMLLLSDMDSTIINQECLDEMAILAGIKDKIQTITEKAMRGEVNFEQALEDRVKYLTGIKASIMNEVYEKKITITSGAKTLVATMRKFGAKTVLISGGFTFFTQRIQKDVGFDYNHANILEVEGGIFTGKVQNPILGPNAKLEKLIEYTHKFNLNSNQTISVGDGANDISMIKNSSIGVAYKAKPAVKAITKFKIDYCDLTALLYLQGFSEAEIIYLK